MVRPPVRRAAAFRLDRRRLFELHGWIGIKLSVLLAVIFVTGSIATVSHEIDWLLNPAIRVTPPGAGAGGARVSWGTMYERVRRTYPEAAVTGLFAPRGPRFAAEVFVQRPELEGTRRVYVNPYTGAVQGETSYFNVQRFFRSLHYGLFLEVVGIYVVGFFGFVLLVSLATGLVVYRQWWRGFFRLRVTKGARVFWGDLHRLLGVWSIPFTLIIAVTGIWYFVEMALYHAGRHPAPPAPELSAAKLARHGTAPVPLPLDRQVAIARAAFPGLEIRSIFLPTTPAAPLYVDGQAGDLLVRDRANTVLLDPYDGEVIHIQRAAELAPLHRWSDTADPLHFGTFGGLATQLLWCVLGLALSGLLFSGALLWLRRVRRLSAVAQTGRRGTRASFGGPERPKPPAGEAGFEERVALARPSGRTVSGARADAAHG